MTIIEDRVDTVKLAASYTIGSYILPGKPISDISERLNSKIQLNITTCDNIIDGVKRGRYSLGLIETPIFDRELIYKKWMEDELVVCSKMPIPNSIEESELNRYRLIARKEDSLTRTVIGDFLKKVGLSYKSFKSISEIDNPTAVIQSIKWSRPNRENPTIAIVSKLAIEDELAREELYKSRIKDSPIMRNFYLVYNRDSYSKIDIDEIIKTLKNYK
jgi:DNA-binding transcriptional LysR family regulator